MDTNYFLHFQEPGQVNWDEIVGKGKITLLITDPLLKELDRQKYQKSGKLRERAENLIKKFFKYFEASADHHIRQDLCLRVVELLKIDFDQLDLDKNEADDWFLAYSQAIRSKGEYEEVFLLSNDFGMHNKARQRDIKSVRLPEKYRLPHPQSDLEKENNLLKNELLKIQNRLPRLNLIFENKENHIESMIRDLNELSEKEITQLQENLYSEYPFALKGKEEKFVLEIEDTTIEGLKNIQNMAKTLAKISHFHGPSHQQLEEYDNKLEEFFKKMVEFEIKSRQFEKLKARSIFFKLCIENVGNAMATNIRVNVHFPISKNCKIMLAEELEEMTPEKPDAPDYPESQFDMFKGLLRSDMNFPIYRPEITAEPNVSVPKITPTQSFDLDFNIDGLIQFTADNTEELVLVFPNLEEPHSFAATYSVICPEFIEPVRGKLYFNVSKS